MYQNVLFRIIFLFAVAMFLAPAVQAQDSSDWAGKWKLKAQVESEVQIHNFTIKRSGDNYSGYIIREGAEKGQDLKKIAADGKKMTFEFGQKADGKVFRFEVEMVLDTDEKMIGVYSIYDGTNVVFKGTADALKEAKKLKSLSGSWAAVAGLPDGNEMQSEMILKSKNGELSGVVIGTSGENEIDKITVDGKKAKFELEIDAQGNMVDIVIEAELESDDSLVGKWMLMQDGNEAATGDWSAERTSSESDSITVLFDGSSLEHFRGFAKEKVGDGWKIVDGTLHLKGGKPRAGDIVTKEQYGSFELEFEWKVSAGGNSGVMYRVALGKKKPWHTGPEYQVLDDSAHKDGKNPSTSAGAIYALYPPVGKKLKPIGEWNSSKIVLNGNKLEHWLNGTKVAHGEIGSADWNEKVAASKFDKQADFGKMKKGHICFQDHGNPIWFRNIKIKSLD